MNPILFSPLRIGSVQLPNRIAVFVRVAPDVWVPARLAQAAE